MLIMSMPRTMIILWTVSTHSGAAFKCAVIHYINSTTVWKTFSDKQQAKEIAEYLEALRNRTYVRPSRPEGRKEPSAAAKTKHKNQAAQAYHDVLARLPMHITILEDGSQSECETLLTHSLTTAATEISFPSDIFVRSYNMMTFSAAACLADF